MTILRAASATDLPAIEPLWNALYDHQRSHQMLLDVKPGGFAPWAASLTPALGRFTCLFVVESPEGLRGFLAGRIRPLPAHFGGFAVGFVSEVFVDEDLRGQGWGKALVQQACEWFAGQGISRVELQVIVQNNQAREVYRRLGWQEELIQMVYTLHPPESQ